jgi:hypothetical protein
MLTFWIDYLPHVLKRSFIKCSFRSAHVLPKIDNPRDSVVLQKLLAVDASFHDIMGRFAERIGGTQELLRHFMGHIELALLL